MRLSFQQRVEESGPYVSMNDTGAAFNNYFNYEFGYGEITPVYTAHLETIIPAWRIYLKNKNLLLEEDFDLLSLKISDENIEYTGITAQRLSSAMASPAATIHILKIFLLLAIKVKPCCLIFLNCLPTVFIKRDDAGATGYFRPLVDGLSLSMGL